jgi:mycofactocin precursor
MRRRRYVDTTYSDAKGNAPSPDSADEPAILEEIEVEDLAVDGICGVY